MKQTPCPAVQLTRVVLFIAPLVFSLFACKKQPTPPPQPAHGSLVFESGNCYPYTVHGNYYAGVAADDSNYVEIFVRVTQPGTYKITTDEQFGVSFSASGTFAYSGINPVHLKSSGVFTDFSQPADFHTWFDSTTCGFRVTVWDSAALHFPENTWQMMAGGQLYQGPIAGVDTLYPGGDATNFFYGSMKGFSDTSLILFYGTSVYNGGACSHPTSDVASFHFASSRFATGASVQYNANTATAAKGAVIDISSCNSNVITSFNGNAVDSAGNLVPITNARFRCSNIQGHYF